MLSLALALAGVLVAPPPLGLPESPDLPMAPVDGIYRLDTGLVLPYPLDNLFRGWVECTSRGHHRALDIGGVGPDEGLGTRVRSMGRARVIEIGESNVDPARFGVPLKDRDTVKRGQRELPAWKDVPGYGKVFFFSKNYGTYRTGRFVATKILDGPLTGMTARYLHLGALNPALEVGTIVSAGEELGLLGGTAVLDAPPHVHVDLETPEGDHVDVGRVLGIGPTRVPCHAGDALMQGIRARYSKGARVLMAVLRATAAQTRDVPKALGSCGKEDVTGDFLGGDVKARRVMLPADEAALEAPWQIRLVATEGKWQPRLEFEDALGNPLFAGIQARPAAKKRWDFVSKANGLKGGAAEVAVTPHEAGPLAAKITAWPVNKAALKTATWKLELMRPCKP